MRVHHQDSLIEDAIEQAKSLGAPLQSERLDFVRCEPRALGIGNFDGVHLGHQEIFRRVRGRADEASLRSGALTFVPHPTRFFRPDLAAELITPLARKLRILCGCGLDELIILPFDATLAAMPAEVFVQQMLVNRLGIRFVVVGARFAFGQGRGGSIATLQGMGPSCGFEALGVDPVCDEGGVAISSSRVRQLVREGDMREAAKLMGRPFALEGTIETGAGRGRTIGFPTANLAPNTRLLPARGVYAAWVAIEGQRREAVVNIGRAPTFVDNGAMRVEIHVLDFSGDLVNSRMQIDFTRRMRDEQRFANVNELIAAIREDIAMARRVLNDDAHGRGEPRCA
ncbi:MAG: bifunctional riboflavin kinase/FAD synthetase [Deltaproteobacteria bacterium]|nr:bifunctional riboflavin kinase/FAD synthetase [Deltaproteobacteria bacterium]